MGQYYSLLTAVGNYKNGKNLPSYEMDLKLMRDALTRGLKITPDNIRSLGDDGVVKTRSFALILREFASMIKEDDGFIFYFSGHGCDGYLAFSDEMISIQNIVDYMGNLKAKNKIIILDCCYSGKFGVSGVRQINLEDAISTFVGTGTTVFASSAADEKSWLSPDGTHSLYTGMMTTAITMKWRSRKGKISLADINEGVVHIAKIWNEKNPDKIQHPIYRANTGGTIYFEVEKYHPYQTLQVYRKTEKYIIRNVEPLSSLQEKRLSVFVLVHNKCKEKELAKFTREIVDYVKYTNVFSNKASELRFKGMPARSVWCYFGYDESDMVNHRYFARTIWCLDSESRKKYFSKQKNTSIIRNIWISVDSGYEFVRKLQQVDMTKEEFQYQAKRVLSQTVSMAEKYITDIREIDNQTKTISEIRRTYDAWIREVYEEYYKMTEMSMAPDELRDWFNEVENLTGCVLDMAVLLNKDDEYIDGNRWLIQNNIRRYYESLEKLKEMEAE